MLYHKKLQWSRNFSVADWKREFPLLKLVFFASMEPQLFSCGLTALTKVMVLSPVASMEPQLFSCGLMLEILVYIKSSFASMEPQLFSCGLRSLWSYRHTGHRQASMEPQLFSCGLPIWRNEWTLCSVLQWSRNFSVADCRLFHAIGQPWPGFNGAATFQLRIVGTVKRNPAIWRMGFNGAATFQLRIAVNRNQKYYRYHCFNGAATFQLRIASMNSFFSLSDPSFNGAATFQLRIGDACHHHGDASGVASMEPQLFSCGLPRSQDDPASHLTASMEPQLFSCGLINNNDPKRRIENSCNGAATFQLRIAGSNSQPTVFKLASMEPQLFSCGLCAITVQPAHDQFCFNGAATFQLRIAWKQYTVHNSHCNASMEPQLFSCGLFFNTALSYSEYDASMEPQLFSCGLMSEDDKSKDVASMLQWSRNFSVADCWQYDSVWVGEPRFNGAATFQLRIVKKLQARNDLHNLLQWSRNFSVADCIRWILCRSYV